MLRLKWKSSRLDGCLVLTSGRYEIVQGYEPTPDGQWQLNRDGYFYATCPSLKVAKDLADELERLD